MSPARTSGLLKTVSLLLLTVVPAVLCRTRGREFASRRAPKHQVYEEDYHCEPIEIDECKGIGYNYTKMPNSLGHERQNEAQMGLIMYQALIQYNCSSELLFFLCAVHAPMCNEEVQKLIGPCESMCRSVKSNCEKIMESFGYPWPKSLNCSLFPRKNTMLTMCMEGNEIAQKNPETKKPSIPKPNRCR